MVKQVGYFAPKNLEKALDIIGEQGENAKVLAGGTDLIPSLRRGRGWPDYFVYIGAIEELSRLEVEGAALRIGSAVTIAEIEKSPLIAEKAPLLRMAAAEVGGPAVRNLATIGGNIVNASPAADAACALLALDASLTLRSKKGSRDVALADFFKGPKLTLLAPDEILTEVRVPLGGDGARCKFVKMGKRKALAISVVSCAVTLSLGADGACKKARVALGAAAPTPVRAYTSEQALSGRVITDEVLETAAQAASQCADPIDDMRGKAWYRKRMAGQLLKVGVKELLSRSE